jgi:hypothetical protein
MNNENRFNRNPSKELIEFFTDHKKPSKEIVKFAAEWWAQFLPGVGPKVTCSYESVTQEQYDSFVDTLSMEILSKILLIEDYDKAEYRVQMGDTYSYRIPYQIDMALEKAGIELSSRSLFPSGTQMDIYTNRVAVYDSITSDKQVAFFVDPTIAFFNSTMDLDQLQLNASPEVKLKKNYGFRVLEVRLEDDADPRYIKLEASHINGGNEKLCSLSDEELTTILRNQDELELKELISPSMLSTVFAKSTTTKEEFLRGAEYYGIGKLYIEKLNEHCYRQSTYNIKLLNLPEICNSKDCAIRGAFETLLILRSDNLIVANKDGSLNYYTDLGEFSPVLCSGEDCNDLVELQYLALR